MKYDRDPVGKRFGRLTVLNKARPVLVQRYRVRCDCGTIKIVSQTNLRPDGGTRSCGCLAEERVRPLAERFWAKVDRSGGPDACWPYMGARSEGGYGIFRIGFQRDGSARNDIATWVSWELVHGKTPRTRNGKRLVMMHACDNPPCCNPAHLHPGSDAENAADRVRKGRSGFTGFKGEAHPLARLTEEDVRAIRARTTIIPGRQRVKRGTYEQLQKEYGLQRSSLWAVAKGKSWRHVA